MIKAKNISFEKYIFLFMAVGLGLLFFYPVIFQDKTFFFRDIHWWFYPMKYYLAECLKSGHIPFWCPNYFCGSPFMSDIQSGVFYPLSLVFVFFPFPLSTAPVRSSHCPPSFSHAFSI